MKKQIAIYGKGGIGKSTISANLSASFGKLGIRTLQIGCDPKHDSTRLLMNGLRITTVLDYIRDTNPLNYRLNNILFSGYKGVGCIEAGGPEPGVGCAGRGIISVFELLEKFHIKDDYDIILYDVLGDVVCGGFAVPIRKEYADTIFLVTSGEFMSIYAANNILRGIANYDKGKNRVAGIIYNSRNIQKEDDRVAGFAKSVGLPIFAKIPRDDTFAKAEKEHRTVIEQDENEQLIDIFEKIAKGILDEPELYPANPLDDETLEYVVMGTVYEKRQAVEDVEQKQSINNQILSKNVIYDEPLHGCAFNGAMSMSVHIKDMAIIAHSPKSCGYLSYQMITSSGRRHLFGRGALLPISLTPNLISTNMDENDMVFGGTDKLLSLVKKLKNQGDVKGAVIISSCPAGIIGDDIDKAKEIESQDFPVVCIKAEGNLTGDYLQGMLMSYTEIARQTIDKNVKPVKDVVNVIFEKVVARNTDSNFYTMEKYLNTMGVSVNCRFLCNTTFEKVKNFQKASLNLLAFKDYTGNILQDFFEKNYQSKFFDRQFPVGFAETQDWIYGIAKHFGKDCTQIIEQNKEIYNTRIAGIKDRLKGKRLMVTSYNHDLDWILSVAIDLGMVVPKLGIYNYSQDDGFRTKIDLGKTIIDDNYNRENIKADLKEHEIDILLSNYQTDLGGTCAILDTIPMCPDVGFFSGLILAERWADLFDTNMEGDWKHDKILFDQFHTR